MIFDVRFLDEWLGSSPDIDHMTAWSADMDWMISSDQARSQDDDDEEVDFEELEVLDPGAPGGHPAEVEMWPFFAKGERGGCSKCSNVAQESDVGNERDVDMDRDCGGVEPTD